MSFIGALILFGLGITMLNTEVQIKDGDVTTITYNGTTATGLETSYNYTNYDFGELGQSSYAMIILLLATALFLIFLFKLGD